MTSDEVEAAVGRALDAKLGQFYIDREVHWEDHKFIEELRKMFEVSRAEMCKNVIKWAFSIVLGLLMLGLAISKGFLGGAK